MGLDDSGGDSMSLHECFSQVCTIFSTHKLIQIKNFEAFGTSGGEGEQKSTLVCATFIIEATGGIIEYKNYVNLKVQVKGDKIWGIEEWFDTEKARAFVDGLMRVGVFEGQGAGKE